MRLHYGASTGFRATRKLMAGARNGKTSLDAKSRARRKLASMIALYNQGSSLAILERIRKRFQEKPLSGASNLEDLAASVRDFAAKIRDSGSRPSKFAKVAARKLFVDLDVAVRCMVAHCVNLKPKQTLKVCGDGGDKPEKTDLCFEYAIDIQSAADGLRKVFAEYAGVYPRRRYHPHTKWAPAKFAPAKCSPYHAVQAKRQVANKVQALHQAINIFINNVGNLPITIDIKKTESGHRVCVIPGSGGGGDDDPPTTKRGKGVSEFSGVLKNSNGKIFVRGGKYLKVGKEKYLFEAAEQWNIINRFLRSIYNCDDNSEGKYPVMFTTGDNNKCKGNCRTLIKKYIERQPVLNPIRNHRFEGRARFKMELLR